MPASGSVGLAILVLYVDDILLHCARRSTHESLVSKLTTRFRMHVLGPVKSFLGLNVRYTANQVTLSHETYISDMLVKFKCSDMASAVTPASETRLVVLDPHSYWLAFL